MYFLVLLLYLYHSMYHTFRMLGELQELDSVRIATSRLAAACIDLSPDIEERAARETYK